MAEKKPKKPRSRASRMSVAPVRLGRRSSGGGRSKPSSSKRGAASKTTASKSTPTKSTTSKAAAAKGSNAKKTPAPNMQERMEGLQGWMAEIERKQARMTRFGGAAAILAVLAAAGALALGIINKNDAATKDDVDELTTKVNELGASLEQQTEKQLKGLQGRLSSIDQRLSAVEQKQSQLQTQVQALETRAASGKGAAATVPTVPPVVGGTTP